MAQQKSLIKLNGKIGDLSFFKTKDGYQARNRTGVSTDRIKNDPSFQRTRENNAEFAGVCRDAKSIRDSLRSIILLTHDPKMASRFSSRMFKMMKADATSARGERKVKNESFILLQDFNFNESAALNNTLFVQAVPTVDRVSGLVSVSIPGIRPDVHLAKPKGATHFQLTMGAALINLDDPSEATVLVTTPSPYLSINTISAPIELLNSLPADAKGPILLILGVTFYQEVNSTYYSMNNGGFNALCVIAVNLL